MDSAQPPRRPVFTGEGKKRKPFDIIGLVLRRAIMVGVCGSFLGLTFAVILYPKGKPVYKAAAVILIDPAKQPTVNGRESNRIPGDIRNWTRTQLARILSEDVLKEAIQRVPLEERPDFLREKPDHPANPFKLMKRIDADEKFGTYLVTLEIENESPNGIAEMLNAVMEVFLEKLQSESEGGLSNRLEYLREERDKIAERLRIEEAALMELAGRVENKAFLHEGYNSHLVKVDQVQRLYWEAFAAETQAKSTLAKVTSDRNKMLEMSLQPFADTRVADNFGINRIEQWTYEQLQRMRASIDGLTEENKDRKYVESRMKAMNAYLREYKDRVNDETITNLNEKRLFELDQELLMAQSAAEAAERNASILKKRLEEARLQAGEISMAIFQASAPNLARNQLRDRLQALANRIDDAEMLAKAPIPVTIDQYAVRPSSPASTSNMKLGLAGFVLGFGFVGGLIFMFELLDERLRSSREIRLALGGDAPDALILKDGLDSRFAHVLLEEPEHPSSHVIRDLATRLYRDHERYGGGVYVVSGVEEDVGATSISINLARALRELEGPVLLIELNLSRPGMREQLEMSACDGVESFLRGKRSLEDSIQRDAAGKLDVLISEGDGRPDDLSALHSLLPGLREDYKLIVVDAGAIRDDIPQLMGQRADGIVLVTKWKSTRYSLLRGAIDRLVHQEVTAVTAVLNQAPRIEKPPIQSFFAAITGKISFIASKVIPHVGKKKPKQPKKTRKSKKAKKKAERGS